MSHRLDRWIGALIGVALCCGLLATRPAHGQTAVAQPLPWLAQPFFNAAGTAPLALGTITSYVAGTTTPRATYSDALMTGTNANPLTLGTDGRASSGIFISTTAGSVSTCYKFVIKTASGTTIATVDNVCDPLAGIKLVFATRNLDNVRLCDQFPGADAGAKIVACIADLPTTGGVADSRGFEGAQTIAADMWTYGSSKPVELLLGCATFSVSVQQNLSTGSSIKGVGDCSVLKKTALDTGIMLSIAPSVGNVEISSVLLTESSVCDQSWTAISNAGTSSRFINGHTLGFYRQFTVTGSASGSTVDNWTGEQFCDTGVQVGRSSNTTVSNSNFAPFVALGAPGAGQAIRLDSGALRVELANLDIYKGDYGIVIQHSGAASGLAAPRYVLASNVDIKDPRATGVFVNIGTDNVSAQFSGVRISGASGMSGACVQVSSGAGVSFAGGDFRQCGTDGVLINGGGPDITIADNRITGVNKLAAACPGVVGDFSDGISLQANTTANVVISGNYIANMDGTLASGSGCYGIRTGAANMPGLTIVGNTVTGMTSGSFSLSNTGSFVVVDATSGVLAPVLRPVATTFANRPVGVLGMVVAFSDAVGPLVWGATISTGGSTNGVLGFFNGIVWTVMGR